MSTPSAAPGPGPLDVLLRDPPRSGIFVDFDGTLSDIVDDPARARPRPGAVPALVSLGSVLGRVGVLSGRPVSFLEPLFPAPIALAGLYGLETRIDGRRRDHPQAGSWREVIDDVASSIERRAPEHVRVERKGLSLTLHYRGHPEVAGQVRTIAEAQAVRSGLVVRLAKMSFELHPPIPADKGSALTGLADELTALAYIGDDLGDLPAFAALDHLAGSGATVIKVAVGSEEEAPPLLAEADWRVDGPAGVVALLEDLSRRAAK